MVGQSHKDTTQLKDLLLRNKDSILDRWLNLIMESYPPDVSKFLKHKSDRFTNPVGYIIMQGTTVLVDEVISGSDSDRTINALDGIIRIRAVQDFTPSQATAFVFLLKRAIREELETEITKGGLFHELSLLDTRIDSMALVAFDLHMQCREEIHRIRTGEIKMEKDMAMKLLSRVKRMESE
jgi:hypothetical protein